MPVVNGLKEAEAALRAANGAYVTLMSPPYAACHAGVGYYRAMLAQLRETFPDAAFTFTLCCGDDPAIAHDALRLGFTSVLCDCGDAVFVELSAVAAQSGATLQRSYPSIVIPAKAGIQL
jgi:hypothetical protein